VYDLRAAVAGWDTFYVIVGSSAAALTGLMFVVISLNRFSGMGTLEDRFLAVRAWGTPTVVHFGAALLVSAILVSPIHTTITLSLLVAACGVIGVGFVRWVSVQAKKVRVYQPIEDDWRWHRNIPLIAYTTLVVGAVLLWWRPDVGLTCAAAGVLLLLFIGIHNSWDAVLWNAIARQDADDKK